MIEEEKNTQNEEIVEEAQEVKEAETSKSDFVIPLTEEEIAGDRTKILPANNKPHWTMRIAAGLIDTCLLFLAAFGFMQLFLSTPMNKPLKEYETNMIYVQDEYKLKPLIEDSTETYGYKIHENEENYNDNLKNHVVHLEDETGYKYIVVDNENISEELTTAYTKSVKADSRYKDYSFYYRLIDSGYTCLAGFASCSIFLLFVPLINKRRATVGKLLAGTMLVNNRYEVEARWYQVLGRFLFQYFVEGVIPFLFMTNGILVAMIMPVVLFLITLTNKKRRTLHDFVSMTKVIDARTFKRIDEQ